MVALCWAALGLLVGGPAVPDLISAPLRTRPAVLIAKDDAPDGESSITDMDALRMRIAKIQQNGLATPEKKLFEIATEKSPGMLLRDFFSTASPAVATAMQDAAVSLLGTLPMSVQFDTQVSTTGDKLAALMLQLQMTGYMLRNAEYVLALRQVLGIKSSRSIQQFRDAFKRIDSDGNGELDATEVQQLLSEVYGGEPPPFEVSSFMQLVDANKDGKITWDDFVTALGGEAGSGPQEMLSLPAADVVDVPEPLVSGTVTVVLEGSREMQVDAAEYLSKLKAEALALRKELAQVQQQVNQEQMAVASSLSAYVSQLPTAQQKVLTDGITGDVVEAMKLVVKYILKMPDELSKDGSVSIDQVNLQQLCLYQLVLGYRLREAEAKGEAQARIG